MKKALAVILATVMLLSCVSVMAFAKTSEEADTHLQYNEDGTFRIMQVADMQDFAAMKPITKKLLRKALDTCKPDLIVLTGDNISSSSGTFTLAAAAIHQFMSIFEEYGIPVVMTYGNHDDENTLATKAYQLSVYERYSCFIGCAGEDFGKDNLCTYYVPIYSSTDKNEMVSNVWIVDSGSYNEDADNAIAENDLGGYACVKKNQIQWYKETSEKLEAQYGRKIPSLVFQHIVVPEIWDALEEVPSGTAGSYGHSGKTLALPEGTNGVLGECPCPPAYSNGEFQTMVERGDVMAMFFGHDHTNTYEIEDYQGIDLINTAGVGFNSYNSIDVGVRIIDLNENDPWSYETEMLSYFELNDYDDDCARYLFKAYSDTSSSSTMFAAFFKYIFAAIKALFGC